MVTAADEFIVTESLLFFVSCKPYLVPTVGSTEYLCWTYMHWWGGDGYIYWHILQTCIVTIFC